MSESPIDRFDALLMRVLDGEADAQERAELAALADADARLAEHTDLRDRLRQAMREEVPPIEIVGEVMAALALDDGWAPFGQALREGSLGPAVDLADSVMAAIEPGVQLSALHDGELDPAARAALAPRLGRAELDQLTAWAEAGRQIREAVTTHARADLSGTWAAVAPRIGLEDPEHVPGWEPIGAALKEAVHAHSRLSTAEAASMTAGVMARLPKPRPVEVAAAPPAAEPWWKRFFGAPALALAAAAALVLMLVRPAADPPLPAVEEHAPHTLAVAAVNVAAVENLETSSDVSVQVFQQEDGAPMILMIDEGTTL